MLREGNNGANFITKNGAKGDAKLLVAFAPPLGMDSLLLADAMGICFPTS